MAQPSLPTRGAVSPSPFDLHVQGIPQTFAVRRFRATERISTPYEVEIEADAILDGHDRPLLGARARLVSPRTNGPGRTFHGVLTSCERRGRDRDGAVRFGLVLEPRLATLRLTRHRRIFHEQTSVAIAQHILREHGVTHRLRLVDEYPTHAHRIQCDESDLAFVERILFEEGIFYFFDHPAEAVTDDPDATNLGRSEVLVLCDTARYYPRVEPDAPLVHRAFATPDAVAGDETTAFDIRRIERSRPSAVLVRGREPQRPVVALGDDDDRREPIAEADRMRRVFGRRPHLVYEAQGSLEDRPPLVPTAARLLDETRVDAVEVAGGTLNPYLMPGRVFRLEGHDDPEAGDEHVVVAVEHHGEAPSDFGQGTSRTPYRNDVTAVPASTTLRPARRSKPRVDGFDAAIVVGPEGQEIHTDEHGRVKVLFLWDLESRADDKASAWLRVMQPWAGAGFGAQFLPRVGMEVMVAFVGGDIDRPIVVGCVHNGVSPPPFRYPEEKTKLGIRSRRTPDGGGLSEFVIDDLRDKESVSIRSQRDLMMQVLGEHNLQVGGGSTEKVGARRVTVQGDATQDVEGHHVERVLGGESRTVGGAGAYDVAGDVSFTIGGSLSQRVGRQATVIVSENIDLIAGAGDDGGTFSLRAGTSMGLGALDAIDLVAGHCIRMRVADNILEVNREGIHLQAKRFSVKADRIDLVGGGASLLLAGNVGLAGGEVVASSKGAQLKLDADAHLDGAQVLLNCGPGSPAGASAGLSEEKGTLLFQVIDPAAMKVGRRYVMRIAGPDGATNEHPVDVDGKVVVEGRRGERFTLSELLCDGKPVGMTEV